MTRRLYWIAVGLAVAVFGVGLGVAYVGYASSSGPDGVVRAYYAALQRGDAPDALAFGRVPDGAHVLLTSRVLAAQQRIAPLQHVRLVSTSQHGAYASVRVRYTLAFPGAPRQVSDTVAVHRSGGSWRLVRTAVPTQLELTKALLRATIVGAGIPEGTVLMFPGAVPIRFDSAYLSLDPASAQVDFHAPPTTQVTPQLSRPGRRAAYAALATALARCLSAAAGPTCPLPSGRYLPGRQRAHVVGALDGQVSVMLQPDAAGVLDFAGSVHVRGTFRRLDFTDRVVTARGTVDLPVSATAYAIAPLRLTWSRT